MLADTVLLATLPVIAGFIALPACIAWCQRRATREALEVASALAEYAATARRDAGREVTATPPDPTLIARVARLGVPELASLQFARELVHPQPHLLADTAQRLALRLKRRVAFDRKMLARTASGRRRGAMAAAIAPALLLAFHAGGLSIPLGALVFVFCVEGAGCWLLWRFARVGV